MPLLDVPLVPLLQPAPSGGCCLGTGCSQPAPAPEQAAARGSPVKPWSSLPSRRKALLWGRTNPLPQHPTLLHLDCSIQGRENGVGEITRSILRLRIVIIVDTRGLPAGLGTEHTPRRTWRLLRPLEQGEESVKKSSGTFCMW